MIPREIERKIAKERRMRKGEKRKGERKIAATNHLVMFSSTDDTVHTIESSRSHKQDVGRVDSNALSTELTRVPLRNIDDSTLEEFQHTL